MPSPDAARAAAAQIARETRAMYRRRGLCPYCYGERRAQPGMEACRECAQHRAEGMKIRRAERLAAGLCEKCGNPRGENGTQARCRTCADEHNRYSGRSYARHRKRNPGECFWCGRPVAPGCAGCSDCMAKSRERSTAYYRAKQMLRPTCEHAHMRVNVRVYPDTVYERNGQARVRIRWRETCALCRKATQRTVWVQMERLLELLALSGTGGKRHAR